MSAQFLTVLQLDVVQAMLKVNNLFNPETNKIGNEKHCTDTIDPCDSFDNQGPPLPPLLQRTSARGTDQQFLERALRIIAEEDPLKTRNINGIVVPQFFGGMATHITLLSPNGDIFSWIDSFGSISECSFDCHITNFVPTENDDPIYR